MSEFLSRPGAVEAAEPDAGVAAHYGNPLAEQRALARGEAVVDLSHRGVLTITGEDRLSWLHSLTSQNLSGLKPGDSAETLLLAQTGRIEHAIRVVDDGTTAWLLVEGAETQSLREWLDSMRFMLRVEIADRSDEFAVIGSLGELPVAAAAPGAVPLVWVDPWHEVVQGGYQYASEQEHPAAQWTWRESLIERSRLGELADTPAAGVLAMEALRIAAWRPRRSSEVDDKTIPHELDWMRSAVHLTKGCYRGQETVAKVHNLGHPPRRLVMLHLDGSDSVLPDAGSPVLIGDKQVGRVTSSALHWELGPIALAVLKRTTDPDATLTVLAGDTEVAAAQQVIVPVDAGSVAPPPRLPRLGLSSR